MPISNIKAPKNGYCFVYVSNESDEMQYFDNLQVTQNHARIIEENHYYAYGLKIAAISSKKIPDAAEGRITNKDLYNDKELIDDADLDWYDYGFRSYDPQIGRFPQLDPLTDDYPYYTPYQYAGNEPIANVDMDGLEPCPVNIAGAGAGVSLGSGIIRSLVVNSAKISINIIEQKAVRDGISNGLSHPIMLRNGPANDGQLRKDGSRMFANQNDAYKFMFNQSMNNNYREVFAAVLKTSVLVLPDYINTSSESTPENYRYSWKNGNIYDPVSKTTLPTKFTIHTHLNPDPYYYNPPNGADQYYFAKNTPNKPYLTMAKDGFVYGNYGSYKNGKIQSTQIAFDRGGVMRVTNGMIIKSFALREYLQYYMKNVAKIQ